jgi:lysophospholipase L1-like esterase
MRLISSFYLMISFVGSAAGVTAAGAPDLPKPLAGVKRVVFLGDSITWAGGYIEELELTLATRFPRSRLEVINLGLPSETVSGLTEPNHAAGEFPRPDLHERLDRVLAKLKPDLVVACYGMNDGIYHPLSKERFDAFKEGMQKLRSKVLRTGARLWVLTPATFDSLPIRSSTLPTGRDSYPSGQPYVGYDDVLAEYSKWERARSLKGVQVVDVHSALRKYIDERRKTEPDFTFASDGVHPNDLGQRLIAAELLRAWGLSTIPTRNVPPEVVKFIHERHAILRDAWLSEVGHKRPGMTKGLPIPEAAAIAKAIDEKILALLANDGK